MFRTLSYMTLLCSLLLHIHLRLYCFVLFTESRGFLYNVFCAGGVDKENPLNPKDNRENGVMAFFRDGVGPILNKAWFKTLVMLIFFGYLAVSAWGVTQLREGLERRKLSRYDSYSVTFYDTDDKYFREYPYRVNVSGDFFSSLDYPFLVQSDFFGWHCFYFAQKTGKWDECSQQTGIFSVLLRFKKIQSRLKKLFVQKILLKSIAFCRTFFDVLSCKKKRVS